MDYAISMYQAGRKVYPEECNFNSYSELGLLCPECKQEVYLRKGDIRKPYFAHLHSTNSRQVKQCSLRVSSDENAINTNIFIEDRGQRLKLFQQQFLSMFYIGREKLVNDVNFNYWINSIKDDNNQAFNNAIDDCLEYIIKNRQSLERKYIVSLNKIKNKQIRLQQQIALEAMNYLCANAKFNFNLRYLVSYSIYEYYKYEKHKILQQNLITKDVDRICQHTVKIIILNPWLSALKNTEINDINNKTQPSIIRINKQKILSTSIQSPIQPPIPFICYGGKKLEHTLRYTLEITSTKPYKISVYYHLVRSRKGKLINDKIEVFTIEAGIGYLKPTFDIIPLNDKLVFSSQVNGKKTKFDFHYKVIKLLALPYWIDNASQYVQLNELAPIWLVISKLWLKADIEQNEALTIEDTLKQRQFTELNWWKSLIESAKLLPDCVQLQQGLKSIPKQYQHLLNSTYSQINESLKENHLNLYPKEVSESKQQLLKVEQTKTVVNTCKSGLFDNCSLLFQITLIQGDYLYHVSNPILLLEVCLEQDRLVLYRLGESYNSLFKSDNSTTKLEKILILTDKNVSEFQELNMIQERTKLIELGVIITSTFNVYKWQATQPQYEKLAKLLNKSTNLPEEVRKEYRGLFLTNETLSIGDRVLCKKVNIGNKVIVKSSLNQTFMNGHNSPKPECLWLEQLRNDITKRMLQANKEQIKQNVENYIVNNSDKTILKAEHDVKKCNQYSRATVRKWQPNATDSDITRLGFLICEYIFTKLNLNKYDAIGLLHKLKHDEQAYIKLRDTVITPELGHLRDASTLGSIC
ncbi:hypothetical protein I8748_16360 [Nostoc sp. CENA67]|uniref:Competence protein CoiA-like N-terminal domain-containing protein n=1 Tax=Amazonocrinis nigriterrae CENA67 TaxID=2794033 RepID=A0A8J7HWR4_9NOST|nr:hypothetical protein [Amazonocrinis nigriterrae]MBH8563744.1 hypothetical protein [Amazonocrinis nigriterrae CENA67]